MKHSVVRLHLFGVLLAGLASPAFADGNPIPWPKKLRELALTVTVGSPKLVANGSPIPWPKPKLVDDGAQIPWPKPKLVADGSPIPEPGSGSVAVR